MTLESSTEQINVTAFYKFVSLTEEQLQELEGLFRSFADLTGLKGLIVTALEGINGTVAGSADTIKSFKAQMNASAYFAEVSFKDSTAQKMPFRRFKIDRREEIVTLGKEVELDFNNKSYLSPAQWQSFIDSKEDHIMLDTRNSYEVQLGKFKGAIDPGIETFGQFSEFVRNSELPREKTVLMYCTGGIRCEKALQEMKSQGYEKVYQLQGGILNYLKDFPDRDFEGECFVFDHRVALNQELKASSRYKLCPHCGNPGKEEIKCENCAKSAVICKGCSDITYRLTCSKNCAYHFKKKLNSKAV
jgi:UPF0176 protein